MLPLIAMLLLAVMQLGVTFGHYLSLTDAVSSGARHATVSRLTPYPTAVTTSAVLAAAGALDPAKVQVTVSSTWAAGAPVTVTASYPYAIDILGIVVHSGRLESTSTGRVE